MAWVYLSEKEVGEAMMNNNLNAKLLLEIAAQLRSIEFDLNELRSLQRSR